LMILCIITSTNFTTLSAVESKIAGSYSSIDKPAKKHKKKKRSNRSGTSKTPRNKHKIG